jgi:hypothetical protein
MMNMITLTFRVDELVLKQDSADPLDSIDAGVLQNSYFVMPVRFQVKGEDLLGTLETPWCPLPIIDLAVVGLGCISSLKVEGKAIYDLPEMGGQLSFVATGGKVAVLAPNGKRVSCDYKVLLSAFQKCASEVRLFLEEKAPALCNHPYWGKWLNIG